MIRVALTKHKPTLSRKSIQKEVDASLPLSTLFSNRATLYTSISMSSTSQVSIFAPRLLLIILMFNFRINLGRQRNRAKKPCMQGRRYRSSLVLELTRNLTIYNQEQEQLAALREQQKEAAAAAAARDKDFEGGYGGQEDLEDRYATTSGEH